MVLFPVGLDRVLWANGLGAKLFGHREIYDFLERGVGAADITFRQIKTTAQQLNSEGDHRNVMIRIAKAFQKVTVQASVERIRLSSSEEAILFSVPVSAKGLSLQQTAAQMLEGLDDPDTHMAVIGGDGEVISGSPGFQQLGITPQAAKTLITLAGNHPERLVKRPVATGKGYLPAAVGRLSDEPSLNLFFAVETAIGHLDPIDLPGSSTSDPVVAGVEAPAHNPDYSETLDAVAHIEEIEEPVDDDDFADEQEHGSDPAQANASITPDDVGAGFDEDHDLSNKRLPAAEEARTSDAGPASNDLDDIAGEGSEAAVSVSASDKSEILEETVPQSQIDEVLHDEPISDSASVSEGSKFQYQPTSRATRFVWKIDAHGRFSEVSSEFASAVGAHSADIVGRTFEEMNALFHIDPEHKVEEALARRDTWSGKTIHWPIEGTSLSVPVDLAALPTYTRTRDFDGFRGFGVVRLADAVEDPLAIGLKLGFEDLFENVDTHDAIPIEQEGMEELESEDISGADEQLGIQPYSGETDQGETLAVESEPVSFDPAADEESIPQADEEAMPADMTTPTDLADDTKIDQDQKDPKATEHGELMSDAGKTPEDLAPAPSVPASTTNIIPFQSGSAAGLSNAEQANFREIARRLEALGTGKLAALSKETSTQARTAVEEPSDAKELSTTQAFEESNDPDDGSDAKEQSLVGHASDQKSVTSHAEDDVPSEDEMPVEGMEETIPAADVLAHLIPPRARMKGGLSADAVDLLPLAILIHVGDRLLHANAEFLRLTGYSSLEALEEVGGLDALLQRGDLENEENAGTLTLVREDDVLLPVMARLQSIRWEDTSALMLALMPVGGEHVLPPPEESPSASRGADRLTEKVARLQVEVEELRSILETATDGVVVIGADGEIRSMNRSASALFNYDDEETRGKPFAMLFAHESQKAVMDYVHGLAEHGVASVLNDGREVIGREAGGGFVPLFMTMGRLTSSDGFCAVIRDITQWKRTEEELRAAKGAAETANAHKTDFLARVSHEIRTPLNAIIGFSDMMANERFGAIGHPRYIEYANDIGRSGRHVLDIVNDLLDISKIEAGEMDLDFTAVGLNEALAEAVSLVQPQANAQRIIIRTALSHAVPHVVADLRSIKQIALNILSNAIRFTPSGGQVVVSTSYETNGSVVLRVRDTGIGMSRSELEQAMKPFRQVSTQSRHRGDGTGLGLPLTKAMVDANRAVFAINSSPNEGTLVEITFPSQRVLAG